MTRELEHLSCKDRLREFGFSPQKRRVRGDLSTAAKYLKGAYKKGPSTKDRVYWF